MSTHAELVQRAVRWLRGRHSCAVVFAEMTTAVSETPDVIGWYRSTSHVVEVKVSRPDFRRDREKLHVRSGQSMGHFRWYLTPPGIVRPDELPSGYGLAETRGSRIVVVREPEPREDRSAANEIRLLVSAVQRAHLGVRFDHDAARWESYLAGRARARQAVQDHPVRTAAVGLTPDPAAHHPTPCAFATGLTPTDRDGSTEHPRK